MVSAVITTYKRDKETVLRAIKSVLSQTFKDLELIIVDDNGSEYDGSASLLTAINDIEDSRIRYYKHDKTRGECAARNTGLKEAKGEYIAFLDDDDEWLPEKIEVLESVFKRTEEKLALVYCQFLFVDDDTSLVTLPKEKFVDFKRGFIYDYLIYDNFIASTSFPLIRTECLKEIGGFDEKMQSCQDYDVWLRLAKKYQFDFVDIPLVRYHIHSKESIGKNPGKRIRGQERIYYKNLEYLNKHREAAWSRLSKMAPMYSDNKEYANAFKTICRMVSKRPSAVFDNAKVVFKTLKSAI